MNLLKICFLPLPVSTGAKCVVSNLAPTITVGASGIVFITNLGKVS